MTLYSPWSDGSIGHELLVLLTALGMMELCIHSPLAVHCLLTSAVRRSYGLQRSSRPSVRQREPSQQLKVVWIGLSSSPLIPEGAVVFQLLSKLDGLGLCLQICYRGKPLKFWTPLFMPKALSYMKVEALLS